MQRTDAFSRCTPAVNFIFFALAIVLCMFILHPAYLVVSFLGSALYYLTLKGRRALKTIAGLLVLLAVLALLNPVLNTRGAHVLFRWFDRPYTLEAMCYGAALGTMFISVLLWFLSYNEVMTSDKFTSLFGNLIPALSLLLVMILRLVPSYMKKTAQIAGARRCIGHSVRAAATTKEKVKSGVTILSAMTSWALESSIITSDSMRSRGYGAAKRVSFRIYRFTARDGLLLAATLIPAAVVVAAAVTGQTAAAFTPRIELAPVGTFSAIGLAAYALFVLIPMLLNLWEAVTWHISISRI